MRESCKVARAVTELSRYVFAVLRRDEGFILYRGRNNSDASQVLVVAPAAEYPTAESLKQLEHEYSVREELDPTWAAIVYRAIEDSLSECACLLKTLHLQPYWGNYFL